MMHEFTNDPFHDPADSPDASYTPDIIAEIEPTEEGMIHFSEAARLVRIAIQESLENEREGLTLRCYAVAFGILSEEQSLAHIAEMYGITREAVRKRIKDIRKRFGVRAHFFSKRASAGASYRSSNHRPYKMRLPSSVGGHKGS